MAYHKKYNKSGYKKKYNKKNKSNNNYSGVYNNSYLTMEQLDQMQAEMAAREAGTLGGETKERLAMLSELEGSLAAGRRKASADNKSAYYMQKVRKRHRW